MERRSPTAPAVIVMAALMIIVTYAFAGAKPAGAALSGDIDKAQVLMTQQRWSEAAKVLDKALLASPDAPELHVLRGRCSLGVMDLSGATTHFDRTLSLDDGLQSQVGESWKDAALQSLEEGNLDRAVAMFAKAFYHDRALGAELGALTIEAAQKVADEDKRAGYMTRAVAWSGTGPVLKASIAHYARTFGPPRKVYLENPGWVDVAKLRPGDDILYLSEQPFQQRDASTIRIVPAAVTQPMKLTVAEKDTNGGEETLIRVARHQLPTSAYIWLLPGAD